MFNDLKSIIAKLRDPNGGCPWDLKQTHDSLMKYLLEECYEFFAAVESRDFNNMKDELGDILLQILLHAQLASESNNFTLEDIEENLKNKLIRRHPHVFGDLQGKTLSVQEIKSNWNKIKTVEKSQSTNKEKDDSHYFFKTKDAYNPALLASYNIGDKSSQINFDWENYSQVCYKVEEEWQEVKEELASSQINKERAEEELGDLLFSISQLCRHLQINPEKCLQKANSKFIKRVHGIEDLANQDKLKIKELNNSQMERYWDLIKQNEIENKSKSNNENV